jgi:hypothetical protein
MDGAGRPVEVAAGAQVTRQLRWRESAESKVRIPLASGESDELRSSAGSVTTAGSKIRPWGYPDHLIIRAYFFGHNDLIPRISVTVASASLSQGPILG